MLASLGQEVIETVSRISLGGVTLNLLLIEDLAEKISKSVGTPADRTPRGAARRLGFALGAASSAASALVLLGDVVQDELGRTLMRVFEDKGYAADSSSKVRVVQEHLAPELSKLLRWVSIAISHAEITDGKVVAVIIDADSQGAAELVLDELALICERVFGATVGKLRPARGRN